MSTSTHRGVRFRPDTGWEMRCDGCAAGGGGARFWPIDHEFWDYERGLLVCRACHLAKARRRRRKAAGYVAYLSEKRRAYQREWVRERRRQEREDKAA